MDIRKEAEFAADLAEAKASLDKAADAYKVMAESLKIYYNSLIASGFDGQSALVLTRQMQERMLRGK